MTISERAAYVKGLVAGLPLDGDSAESKAIMALCDLCDELAAEIKHISLRAGALEQALEDVNEYVDAIDSDLFTVEEKLDLNDLLEDFGSGLDDDYDDEYDYDDDDDDDDDALYQITCPKCGSDCIFTDDDVIGEDGVICPECGEVIKWDIGEEAEEEESED
ncbi:MAG: hypothetical protein K6G90_14210 [Clostridia bacterium]|nr:hypothetical protein [Clostridia bacterium]